MKVIFMSAYTIFLGIALTMWGYSCVNIPSPILPSIEIQEESIPEDLAVADIFDNAEKITGCPAEILRGIAAAESRFVASAVGDNGQSHGMFQLHSRWHDSRVEKYGEFDPFKSSEAAIIAGYVIQENLRSFNGNLRLAIAAYRQGVAGVIRNGATDWYVDTISNWREDSEKVLSFYIFKGITKSGRNGNGHYGFGTQVAHRFNDTPAVQISWRGSSGFPYQ